MADKKKKDIDLAVDYVLGPTVSFKPDKNGAVPGKTSGYKSDVPAPGTIGPAVQKGGGFQQVGLFTIDPKKNAPKKKGKQPLNDMWCP